MRLRFFVKMPTVPLESDFWSAKRETMPVSDVSFKNILELLRENMSIPEPLDRPDSVLGPGLEELPPPEDLKVKLI
jgi:hypothetical protein